MEKKILKTAGWLVLAGAGIALALFGFFWFKPHRNVQKTDAYATIKAHELVQEFTKDPSKANAKYLSSDGNSKVLIVEGSVSEIRMNQNGEKILLLKEAGEKMGVSANFTGKTEAGTELVKPGDRVRIKGAITAGNSYDPDIGLYEHAILVDCALLP